MITMTDLPLVSIIMPAYNARRFVAEAINSVMEQDYPNWELIIVDDGSSDGTPDEIRKFGDAVRLIEQQNAGPGAARNRGVREAKGDFLAFIDADDIWCKDKISAQMRHLMENPDVGIVFGRLKRWSPNPDNTYPPPPPVFPEEQKMSLVAEESGWIYPEMLLDSVIWIVSAMVRTEVWRKLGGIDESLRVGEDYDLFLRASRLCQIDELDRIVAIYRNNLQSTTHTVRKIHPEYFVLNRSIERYGLVGVDGRKVDQKLLNNRLFKLCFNHGHLHFWHGDATIARKAFSEAISYHIYSAKAWLYWVAATFKSLTNDTKRH